MRKRRTIFDDGFQAYLTEGAFFVGEPGIPMLMDLNNTQVPKGLIPFSKAKRCNNLRQYVHFYEHDIAFARVLTATSSYLELLKSFDGVITPDCTLLIKQSSCLQQTNTYMNRAVGFFLQKHGVPVIPNIRWSDESSFAYCFLGVPQNQIVAVSTHGCITGRDQRQMFKTGVGAMLENLHPRAVIVHGYMPDDIFGEFIDDVPFYRFPSLFELTHTKKEGVR